jgi:membrane protease subunit (stomatin/prohibitin family)
MADKTFSPQEIMTSLTSLFAGRSRYEQMAILGRLEFSGAALYRGFAAEEKNTKAREALLKAAEREDSNGELLRLMTTPKDRCEKCGRARAEHSGTYVCSFQCTFCSDCADGLKRVCPNCGGALEPAPPG